MESSEKQNNQVENAWTTITDELANEDNEQTEEESVFFLEKPEFNPDEMQEFRNFLFEASSDELAEIIDSRVSALESGSEKVDKISPLNFSQKLHRGYISKDTTIQFEAVIGSQFKLRKTEYLHEAIDFLRHNHEKIKNGNQLFQHLTCFLISYFGMPDPNSDRYDAIDAAAGLSNIQDDEEYWSAINNVDISYFKGQNVAMCSERSAMAQNIMAFFGYETYFAVGEASVNGEPAGGHAYNVVDDGTGKKYIVDYSMCSSLECNGKLWQMQTMSPINDFDTFTHGEPVKASSWRHAIQNDGQVTHTQADRFIYRLLQ